MHRTSKASIYIHAPAEWNMRHGHASFAPGREALIIGYLDTAESKEYNRLAAQIVECMQHSFWAYWFNSDLAP